MTVSPSPWAPKDFALLFNTLSFNDKQKPIKKKDMHKVDG